VKDTWLAISYHIKRTSFKEDMIRFVPNLIWFADFIGYQVSELRDIPSMEKFKEK